MKNQKVKKAANLFASGVLALTVANLVVKVIGVLLKVPLQNVIGDTGMGYYSNAYDVYVWLFMIATTGIPVAIAMMVSESRAKGNFREPKKIFRVSLIALMILGFAGMCVMIFGSGFIAQTLYKMPGQELAIICIAPTLFFICISCAIRGFFQGHQNMIPTAVSEVIEALGKLIIGIILAVYAMNLIPDTNPKKFAIAAAMAILGPTIGVAVSMFYLIIKKATFKEELYNAEYERPDSYSMPVRSNGEILKRLLIIAIPITLSSSVMSFTSMLDGMIISDRLQMLGVSPDEVATTIGYFKVQVMTFFNLPPVLIYPISGSIVPYLSSLRVSADKSKIHTLMNSSLRVASLIALPCALGMSVLSGPIINLLFAGHPDAPGLLSVQAIAVFFMAMLSMSTSFLQAHNLERKPIISMVAGATVKVVSSWFLIGNDAIRMYGAPIGSLLCYITIVLFNFYFVAKHIGFIPSFRKVFFKPLFASVLCAGAALGSYKLLSSFLGSGRIVTILAILVAAVVYVFAVLIFGAVTKDDFAIIPKGEKIYSLLKKTRLIK